MKVSFYGGARQVSGSNFLVETSQGDRFLIDCGMFQGGKAEEKKNFEPLPYAAEDVDFLILTHAHIDHSGRIPLLVKEGFKGPIYCTKATGDLLDLMLYDSASIQESDAEWETKKNQRQGKAPVEPLYREEDVDKTIPLLSTAAYQQIIQVSEHIRIRFRDAGHILGAASVEIWIEENGISTKLVFSGDLGMPDHMLIRNPEYIEEADYLILESTYGNSLHGDYEESLAQLMQVIEQTTSQGGTVVIPSFAVGRTQELIYEMNKYYEYSHEGQTNPVRIFVDSPMAKKATGIFMKNTEILNDEAQDLIRQGDNIFSFDNLEFTQTVDDSIALNSDKEPKVIISASGMATGGRVRHHLKHNLWKSNNAVIFVGYQGEGTLGRIIQDGAERVKILGDWIACKAKVYDMEGFSAHADRKTLLNWLDGFQKKPKKVILVHGEDREMLPLADTLKEKYGMEVFTPSAGTSLTLEANQEVQVSGIPTAEDRLDRLETKLQVILAMMNELDNRDIELSGLEEERLVELENTLVSLRSEIMDLNMLTGK